MKIALLTNGIWPYVIGGMQKHSYFLCKYLARNKIEVVLVHTNQQPDLDIHKLEHFSEEEKKYITSIVIDTPQVRYFPGHYVYKSYLYSKAVYDVIKNIGNLDFVIAKSTTAWYLFRKRKNGSIPVGINIHGYEFMQRKANIRSILESWLLRWPFIFVNRKADYVFSYGGKITELIKSLGVNHSRIIELPAGIETAWMANHIVESKQIRSFVFTGRFERRKGVQELTAIIKELHAVYNFEFHFIGPIPPKERLDLPGIIYHGTVRDKSILQDILQSAQILVCPSYAEGMPNVILEGMANGCAIIATNVGAVNEMVDESTGWLIPPANQASLKKAMIDALTINSKDLDLLRKNAFQKVADDFTWDNVIEKTISELKCRIDESKKHKLAGSLLD